MDLAAIGTFVSTVGFPIAAVVALAFFIYRIYRRSEEREVTLMKEIKETREVNAKAIDTIAHYAEKLDSIQNDIKEIKTDVTVLMSK